MDVNYPLEPVKSQKSRVWKGDSDTRTPTRTDSETIFFSPDEHPRHTAHNTNKKFVNKNFENMNKKF
jgi:hypothetical protein